MAVPRNLKIFGAISLLVIVVWISGLHRIFLGLSLPSDDSRNFGGYFHYKGDDKEDNDATENRDTGDDEGGNVDDGFSNDKKSSTKLVSVYKQDETSDVPSAVPSSKPSALPSRIPSKSPSKSPSENPSFKPSREPKFPSGNDKWWKGCQEGNTTHPHMGARHPNGTLGMIVDPSPHRLRLFHNDDVDEEVIYPNGTRDAAGIEGPGGFEVLKKIRTGLSQSREFLKKQQLAIDDGKTSFFSADGNVTVRTRRSKVLCLIYTVYIPGDNHKNVKAQAGTWAKQCDGFIAASNFTDHSVGAIDLPHFGHEEYGNMWQKVRSMWAYAYDHYLDDYDFFHIGGDDTYVAIDNLRAYLDGPEVSRLENGHLDCIALTLKAAGLSKATEDLRPRPLLFGTPMMLQDWQFPAGGSGYTLNRAALDLFGKVGLPSFMSETIDSKEDFFMGRFFQDNGVGVSDTTDNKNGQRYAGSAQNSFQFRGVGPTQPKFMTRKFGIKFNNGIDHASDQQIGFHLKDDLKMLQSMNHTVSDSIYRYFTFLQNVSSSDLRINSS